MKKTWWSLLAALAVLFVMLFTDDAGGRPSDFTLFLGRFHPALVHLPIGILLLAALLETLTRRPRFASYDKALPVVLLAGAWSAILAAVAGLYLSQGGGYDAGTLAWHKRLGVAVAVLAAAAYMLRSKTPYTDRLQRSYLVALAGVLLGVAIGGHLGGVLTHGDGYLTRYMPDVARSLAGFPPKDERGRLQLENPEEATIYATLIQPILDERCVACHHAGKREGGLALDTYENLLEGGDDGEAVTAGRSGASTLIQRLWLPPKHKDHMPPEGRPQPTVAEAELIRWWIDQGASAEQTLAEAEPTPTIQAIFDGYGLDDIRTGIFALQMPPPNAEAVEALRATGVSVLPLAEDEPFLEVRCLQPTGCMNDAQQKALLPLAQHVAWLDLGRTDVNDTTLAVVVPLVHLTRLHLEQTRITDAGLTHLESLDYLEYLNLYGTEVTDAGLVHLESLPRLRTLYAWQTGVTDAGAGRLQQARPGLDVNLGWSPEPATQAPAPNP